MPWATVERALSRAVLAILGATAMLGYAARTLELCSATAAAIAALRSVVDNAPHTSRQFAGSLVLWVIFGRSSSDPSFLPMRRVISSPLGTGVARRPKRSTLADSNSSMRVRQAGV